MTAPSERRLRVASRAWRDTARARVGGAAAVIGVAAALSCSSQASGPRGTAASIAVTPDSSTVTIGVTVSLTATAKDAAGKPIAAPQFFWSSSDTTIATASQSGVVTGRALGSARIAASADGVSGVATVVVSSPAVGSVVVAPDTLTLRVNTTGQLTATVTDASGHALPGASVEWSTDHPSVATVDGTGLVVARGTGAARITATSGGQSGTAKVTVTQVPVATINITPADPTVAAGQTVQLTAQLADSAGDPIGSGPVTWKSLASDVATVNGAGLVTGVGPGTAVIEAVNGHVVGRDTVTVVPVPVASVTVAPPLDSIAVGGTVTLKATARDGNGNVLTGRAIAWSSADTSIATVDATGVVTGISVGSTLVTATIGGVSGSAAIDVTPGTGSEAVTRRRQTR